MLTLFRGTAEQDQVPNKLKTSTETRGEQAQVRPECSQSNQIVNTTFPSLQPPFEASS